MRVYFRSNLDEARRFTWPTMDTPPVVGDIVTSNQYIGSSKVKLQLQVVQRQFSMNDYNELECDVELHLIPSRWKCITDFEVWFEKCRYSDPRMH